MLMRFILQVSNFRLYPDVQTLYTPMYTVCIPGCTIAVHPGIQEDLQRAFLYNNRNLDKSQILLRLNRQNLIKSIIYIFFGNRIVDEAISIN